ncbi:Bug family tripartite tricarboxylate transporter substrate binding protein [Bordetella muralis]|uniref:Bug family tripartite tricarboxylate transporter substrate binding protein n=1 Tax=Bordetella muralis TaxID=1649130 RepID=UPI0039F11575
MRRLTFVRGAKRPLATQVVSPILSRIAACAASVSLLATAAPSTTHAADFPDKPIRLVVGFPPGGGADFVARQVAQQLGETLRTSVVVDNKPGANGTIAASEVARSAADGYTLLLGVTASQAISPALTPSLPYDAVKDFTPITQIGYTPLVLIVNPKLPVKSLADFLQYAKDSKKPVVYGSAGIGNITHLAAEMFLQSAGAKNFQHVPYKGSAQVITDLIGGRVDAYFDTLPSSLPYIQSGQVRALAVTSSERASNAPDIPTVQEAGVPGFHTTTWFGVFGPAKLSPKITEALYAATRDSMGSKAAKDRMITRGVQPVLDSPDQFANELQADLKRWRDVAQKANISL